MWLLGTSIAAGLVAGAMDMSTQKANKRKAEKHNKAVVEATIDNYAKLSRSEDAVASNSVKDSIDTQIQYLESNAASTAVTVASGVTGSSVDNSKRLHKAKYVQRLNDIDTAREDSMFAINEQASQIHENAQRGMTAIQQPSIGSSLMNAVTTTMSVYGTLDGLSDSMADSKKIKKPKVKGRV